MLGYHAGGRAAVAAAATKAVAAAAPPPLHLHASQHRQLSQRGRRALQSLEPWVSEQLLPSFTHPAPDQWQPSDWLPDPSSSTFLEDLQSLREATQQLPNDLLVVIAGMAVAEEGAPNYLSLMNAMEETGDETGAQSHGWARWWRAWAAEEARHGQLLSSFLYLSGRVDMRAVQVSVQQLIGAGLEVGVEAHPYKMLMYSAFQEYASKVSHGNAARLSGYHGAPSLARLLAAIASDEARHEEAFAAAVAQIFQKDPEGAASALGDLARRGLVMPGARMDDGWHEVANAVGGTRSSGSVRVGSSGSSNGGGSSSSDRVRGGGEGGGDGGRGGSNGASQLYRDYAAAADALGVFTVVDYAAGLEQLLEIWNVPRLRVHGEAAAAQQLLCSLPQGIRRMGELQLEHRLQERRRSQGRSAAFSWIHKRQIPLS